MKNSELQDKILSIVDIDRQIEWFYNHLYTKILLEKRKPLCEAFRNQEIYFDYLEIFAEQENDIYRTFSSNLSDVSYLSKSLEEEQVSASHIIPTYQKITASDLYDCKILSRIRSFLEFFSSILAIEEKAPLAPTKIDSYYFSYIDEQDINYVKSEIKTEFLETFLCFLQANIDRTIENNPASAYQFLLCQKTLLMSHPNLESNFISTLFVYDEPITIDYSSEMKMLGISLNCCDYIREEFAKEQGIYNINSIMTSPHLSFDYILNQLYLQSALVLSQNDDSLLHMEKTFYDHYQKNAHYFPYGVEKAMAIQEIFHHKEEIRDVFTYHKKTN